jgi:hypothetical protein
MGMRKITYGIHNGSKKGIHNFQWNISRNKATPETTEKNTDKRYKDKRHMNINGDNKDINQTELARDKRWISIGDSDKH